MVQLLQNLYQKQLQGIYPKQSQEGQKMTYFANSETVQIETPVGRVYLTINTNEFGEIVRIQPNAGKSTRSIQHMTEAICNLATLALKNEPISAVVDCLVGLQGKDILTIDGVKILSLPDAIGQELARHNNKGE